MLNANRGVVFRWFHWHSLWALLNEFLPVRMFPIFQNYQKNRLPIEYHVYLWQVSSQQPVKCECVMEKKLRYVCKLRNIPNGWINKWGFSKPQRIWIKIACYKAEYTKHGLCVCFCVYYIYWIRRVFHRLQERCSHGAEMSATRCIIPSKTSFWTYTSNWELLIKLKTISTKPTVHTSKSFVVNWISKYMRSLNWK